MKLRHVLSVFALALIPVLGGAQGCVVEDDVASQDDDVTSLTNYEINIERMNAQYPGEYPITKAEDVWSAVVKVGDKLIPAPTHLFGDVINIIPYSNQDGVATADGKVLERGDEVIAKYYPKGRVGIALKMHRPEKRVVDLNSSDAANMKEDFKLQDTHIELVVGVDKAEHGKPGAITLNNPQSYEDGRFGNATYSMIFLEPVFPGWAAAQQNEYMDNIRTVLAGFNAVTNFPGDYNGGDPLGANTPDKLLEYVDQMVRAIAGDSDAQDWFQDAQNQVYCAELAYIAFSGGLHAPLSKAFMAPRVGADVWTKFVEEVKLHNKGVDKATETGELEANESMFVQMNDNKRVALVKLSLADDELAPMWTLAPSSEIAKKQLALRPMTMADIVKEFMRTHLPRQILGEGLAPVQAAVLTKMKPGLLETMGMDQMPESDPRRMAVEALFGKMIETVGTQYGSYAEFQAALEPLMEQARQITGPRDDTGTGLFVPPSLFHVAAQGQYHGLIGFQYLGHGVHASNVQQKAGAEPVEPTPVDEIDREVSCAYIPPAPEGAAGGIINSCGHQAPGGCYCDDACEEYGDCCEDKVDTCGAAGQN